VPICGQVDSVEKIEKLLKGKASEIDDDFTGWSSVDYNCLLIEVLAEFQSDSLQECNAFHEYTRNVQRMQYLFTTS